MNHPRISIIIPSFNQGEYLEQAIQSVLSQGYPDLELIVNDGGSQDSSENVIRKYADQLAFWVSEPDHGQSHAINKGLERATGEIITFFSSDDFYLPGTLLDVADHYCHNPQTGAIVGGFSFLNPGHDQPGEPIKPFLNGPSPLDLTLGPPGKYRLHQVSTFYTRLALNEVGRHVREDMRYVMDRELLYRVCKKYPITLSEKTYGVFRKHPEGKSAAEILPFAHEFSQLYLLCLSGDREHDRQRKKMARYRLERGYVKYSCVVKNFPQAAWALIYAALQNPENLFHRRYWKYWLDVVDI